MSHPMEPLVLEQATSQARGEAHGETWRDEIAQLADIRLVLTLARGRLRGREQVLDVAARHLPVLEAIDHELHAELLGIARGAGLDPALIVVLNHYTDLRDISPESVEGSDRQPTTEGPRGDPGGCTAIHMQGKRGPILAQTWDMHGTAEPYVRMIRVAALGDRPEALCFTLTGCLGMAGMGGRGVGVTINNLTSLDARIGLLWPAVVRRLLAAPTATAALEQLMVTPLSSGHHYMMADCDEFWGVETSGELKIVTQQGIRSAHIHTNHCFDPVLRQREQVSPESTTFRRMDLATDAFARLRPDSIESLWSLLNSHEGYPRSICSHVDEGGGDPSASKTCGILAMELADRAMFVGKGCSDFESALRLQLGPKPAVPGLEFS